MSIDTNDAAVLEPEESVITFHPEDPLAPVIYFEWLRAAPSTAAAPTSDDGDAGSGRVTYEQWRALCTRRHDEEAGL